MATQVKFKGIFSCDGSLRFQFENGDLFYVKSLNDGVMVIEPGCGTEITKFAENITGWFEEGSNFYGVKAIEFSFNEAHVSVTKENATPEAIVQLWRDKMDENYERYKQEREAYMKTPEYRAKRAKELKAKCRGERVEALVKQAMESEELLFKDDEAAANWKQFVEVNSKDFYSNGVVRYAERWAKFMQYLMDKHGVTVKLIAKNASNAADIDGITGFMYGAAVNVLSQVWKHGEELRRWHNKDYGYEGDGVVNPAVLTVNE